MSNFRNVISGVTKKQCTEFALVTVLATIILALYFGNDVFVKAALVLTLLTIVVPVIFYPFAVLWFGLAKVLNVIGSAVMMSVVFFVIVMPVGLVRRMLGRDPLKLRQFKKGKQSVMKDRDHQYIAEDFLHMS